MKSLLPLAQLRSAPVVELAAQASLRRGLLASVFAALQEAPSLAAALAGLQGFADGLLALGLHDEAARLKTFARIVAADVARLDLEAAQLEARAAGPAVVDLPQLSPQSR